MDFCSLVMNWSQSIAFPFHLGLFMRRHFEHRLDLTHDDT